nr:MAG TPA: hypothetical protein [Caudoviricetes sp.]
MGTRRMEVERAAVESMELSIQQRSARVKKLPMRV